MKNNRLFILLAGFTLLLASIACTVSVGGPDYPETRIPISTESVSGLEEQVKAAGTAAAQSGTLSLSITEGQLTSLVTQKLAEQPDPFITEPQVYLRDGQMQIYGKAIQGNLQANIRIVLSVSIDEAGQPAIAVVSTDLGPLPAPEGLNKTITAFVKEAFTGAIGPAAIGFRLESITIADGVMTLTGRVK